MPRNGMMAAIHQHNTSFGDSCSGLGRTNERKKHAHDKEAQQLTVIFAITKSIRKAKQTRAKAFCSAVANIMIIVRLIIQAKEK